MFDFWYCIQAKQQKEEEEDDYKPVPTSSILKMNSSEWPYILGGIIGSAVQGVTIPLYAVMFGDVLGVSATSVSLIKFFFIIVLYYFWTTYCIFYYIFIPVSFSLISAFSFCSFGYIIM